MSKGIKNDQEYEDALARIYAIPADEHQKKRPIRHPHPAQCGH